MQELNKQIKSPMIVMQSFTKEPFECTLQHTIAIYTCNNNGECKALHHSGAPPPPPGTSSKQWHLHGAAMKRPLCSSDARVSQLYPQQTMGDAQPRRKSRASWLVWRKPRSSTCHGARSRKGLVHLEGLCVQLHEIRNPYGRCMRALQAKPSITTTFPNLADPHFLQPPS
jgi:hypothetical protein